MPCLECENGLWKFGKTGKCEYQTKKDCETANADYYNDISHDHHFDFTEDMMKELHDKGELEVTVKEDDKEMVILFTYKQKDVMDIVYESNKFTKRYKNYLAKQYGIKRT
jgi:hypothetical protein